MAVDGWVVIFDTTRNKGTGRAGGNCPPRPLLAVPNVTAM